MSNLLHAGHATETAASAPLEAGALMAAVVGGLMLAAAATYAIVAVMQHKA